MSKKPVLVVCDPGIYPMNGRLMVSIIRQEKVFKKKSGLILPGHLTIDKNNRLTEKAPNIFVVLRVSPDVKPEFHDGVNDARGIKPGDCVVPITQFEYQRQTDGTGKRVEVYQYPVFVDERGNGFYWIDQYEVLAINPEQFDVQILPPDEYDVYLESAAVEANKRK